MMKGKDRICHLTNTVFQILIFIYIFIIQSAMCNTIQIYFRFLFNP